MDKKTSRTFNLPAEHSLLILCLFSRCLLAMMFLCYYSYLLIAFAEPGYYQENEFGMRLENIVTVVKANVTVSNTEILS